jgi:polysaccharide biosynthesis transport protein
MKSGAEMITNGAAAGRPHWRRLLKFGLRKWWILALTSVLALGVQGYLLYTQEDLYTSYARMWVSGHLQIPEGSLYREELQNFAGTQVALMQSGRIVSQAHARVKTSRPQLKPSLVEVKVTLQPRTSLFVLQATGAEREYVQAFLNALMEEYLLAKKQFRTETTDDTLASMTSELSQQEKELKIEQEKLDNFKKEKENDLLVLQEQGSSAAAYLAKLNVQLADLKLEYQVLDLMSPDQNLERLERFTPAPPKAANDSTLTMAQPRDFFAAKQQVQLLKLQRKELGLVLRPKHPKIIKLDEEIAQQEKLIEIFREQSQEQITTARQQLQKRIQGVEEAIQGWEAKALDANRRMTEFEKLKANVQRAQSLYDKLLDLLQSVDVNKSLGQESLSVLEQASVPVPAKVSAPKQLGIGLALGLAVGVGIIYLLERMDDRVTSMTDLVQHFQEEVVGRVPEIKLRRGEPMKLLTDGDDRHMLAESYKNIRSSLMFMARGNERPKTMVITSAIPDEGKSTVIGNLAQTLAMAGSQVLLIDGDLRRGNLHKHFDVPLEPGMTDVLVGTTTAEEVMRSVQPNLSFVAAGSACANPGELFLNTATDALLKQLAARFDFVLIDTPPVLATDDATSLAPKTDGVLFVVRESFSRAGLVKPALDQLYQRQVKVLGLIVNRANSSSKDYCYYKYREYYGPREAAIK